MYLNGDLISGYEGKVFFPEHGWMCSFAFCLDMSVLHELNSKSAGNEPTYIIFKCLQK
jgi:hypothetical protein